MRENFYKNIGNIEMEWVNLEKNGLLNNRIKRGIIFFSIVY